MGLTLPPEMVNHVITLAYSIRGPQRWLSGRSPLIRLVVVMRVAAATRWARLCYCAAGDGNAWIPDRVNSKRIFQLSPATGALNFQRCAAFGAWAAKFLLGR